MSRNCCRQPSVMSIVSRMTPHAAASRSALPRVRELVPKPGIVKRLDLRAGQAEHVERADGDQQRERRVEAARQPDHQPLEPVCDSRFTRPDVWIAMISSVLRFRSASSRGMNGAGSTARLKRAARVGRYVHVDGPPRHPREGVERIAEARRPLAVEPQVLDVHVGDEQVALAREPARLAEDDAVFGDHRVAAEDDVLRGLADAARGVDVGADGARRLLRDQRAPVVRLADQFVGGRQVRPRGARRAAPGTNWAAAGPRGPRRSRRRRPGRGCRARGTAGRCRSGTTRSPMRTSRATRSRADANQRSS